MQVLLGLAGDAAFSRVGRVVTLVLAVGCRSVRRRARDSAAASGPARVTFLHHGGRVCGRGCTDPCVPLGALRARAVRDQDAEHQHGQPQQTQRPRGAGPRHARAQPSRNHAVIVTIARRRGANFPRKHRVNNCTHISRNGSG